MRFFTSFFLSFFLSYYYSESYFAFFFPSFIPSITSDMVCRPRRRILKIYIRTTKYITSPAKEKRNRQISAFFTLFYLHKRRAIHHFWPHVRITHVFIHLLLLKRVLHCVYFRRLASYPASNLSVGQKKMSSVLVVHDEPELVWNSVAQNRQRWVND